MIVHGGWRPYGAIRRVPGVAHVATVFLHFWWIPIAPVRSYIVIEGFEPAAGELTPRGEAKQTRYGFVGVRVPLNWFSVFMGYTRGTLGLAFAIMLLSTIVFTTDVALGKGMKLADAAVSAGLAVGFGTSFWFSRWATRAGWSGANELRADLGLPPSDEAW